MKEKLVIREAEESDTKEITNLIIKVIIELFGREPINRDDYSSFKKFYKKQKGIFYVAEQNNKIIGTVAVKRDIGSTAKLRRMYVLKDYRKKGVGEKLFLKALKFSKDTKYERIILCTYPEMKDAIKFYKKHGFREFKKDDEGEIYFEKLI